MATWRWCAQGVTWWIQRNPMYLLSAVAMALGARWYLVTPDALAGDVRLILLTLGVLQAYELAVSGVLIVLHRRRKSPEDQPSLLLVAALFWTGPMAATVELTARHGEAGLGFAAAACLLALVELQTVRRTIGLRLSPWGQAAASACVVLLAAAPLRLRVPYAAEATDEAALYVFWWVFAGLILLSLGSPIWQSRRRGRVGLGAATPRELHVEMLFLGMVYAATAAHLWGMDYAFFANARAFYAMPALAASAVVLAEYGARVSAGNRWVGSLCAALPAVGIGLATAGFDQSVPVRALPAMLRDPLSAALLLATSAWWYGCVRRGPVLLLHAGSAALLAAAFRMLGATAGMPADFGALLAAVVAAPDTVALAVYGLAGYLLAVAWLRRSRAEILAALVGHVAAFALLVDGRIVADDMAIGLVSGWSWLVGLHVMMVRPRWVVTIWPIALLVLVTVAFGVRPELKWYAVEHAAGLVVILVAVGWLWPWTRYRTLGVVAGATFVALGVGRCLTQGTHPKAAAAMLGAFLLLTSGAVVSWHKRRLLEMTAMPEPRSPVEQ
jgi:hypothetical protein